MENEIVWEDATSYSRDELRNERKPRTWRLELGPQLAVVVMSDHRYNPGKWTMHFRPWFETKCLGMDTQRYSADEAKAVALFHVRQTMKKVNAAIEEKIGGHKETSAATLIATSAARSKIDWKPGEKKRTVGGVIIYRDYAEKVDD